MKKEGEEDDFRAHYRYPIVMTTTMTTTTLMTMTILTTVHSCHQHQLGHAKPIVVVLNFFAGLGLCPCHGRGHDHDLHDLDDHDHDLGANAGLDSYHGYLGSAWDFVGRPGCWRRHTTNSHVGQHGGNM